ncbi:SgcJ/EcaC family oxidoreductase [Nocardioides sp. CER19]|uniref:SgcJ/EcaC family oxidoreductase n=1 Tax=Nocardioides sp. CER19 TaxID=3038538 RepID=UPI002446FB6D|nr:SgcJ/EcaC family oxidoreductase [Nocardioides sp. CER19]MDH2413796.1 SgcJ/EcaC family oxidoreductase [Nocardioides sp. CER19]
MNSYTVSPEDASPDDVAALTELVGVIEQVQRTEDADGFLALFDADAVWVTGAGSRLVGLDVIAEFTRQVLPGAMVDGSVTYDVDHIRFITPDLALTGVNQEYTDVTGEPLHPRSLGRPTYIWMRSGDTWRIVAGQNTTYIEDR